MAENENDNGASVAAELDAQFGNELAGIEARTGNDNLVKGGYIFQITNAYMNHSASSGRKQLIAMCKVLENDADDAQNGSSYFKNWGLETAENFKWLNGDLINLGLERINAGKDCIQRCSQLTGIVFKGSLEPNKDSQYPPTCYINKGARRRDMEGEDAASGEGGAAPF